MRAGPFLVRGECMAVGRINQLTETNEQDPSQRYDIGGIPTWDFIRAKGLSYDEGNVIKYVVRYRHKNGLLDLLKARDYLDRLIRLAGGKPSGNG